MTHRITQEIVEVTSDDPEHGARITQEILEPISSPRPTRATRVTQILLEVVSKEATTQLPHLYVHA